MPDEKKKYFGFLGLVIVLIIGLLFVFLNFLNSHSHNNLPSHNNPPSLEKKEEIINYQEEIKEEIKKDLALLDDMIMNIIFFLLVFLIAIYICYCFSFSPVVRNNLQEIAEDPAKKTLNKSPFRKTASFQGKISFKEVDVFYICEEKKMQLKLKKVGNNHIIGTDLKQPIDLRDFKRYEIEKEITFRVPSKIKKSKKDFSSDKDEKKVNKDEKKVNKKKNGFLKKFL